jgi:homoserine O-acetyltransferase/O-succinyltransferase
VRVQRALLEALGVKRLVAVIGGSLGGMQVLEWGAMYPELVQSLIPIATAAQHSAWCIGLNEVARQAITSDPDWKGGAYDVARQPEKGLSLARQIAMISYRSDVSFHARFGREAKTGSPDAAQFETLLSPVFQVESYLRYQGEKLVARFDANTYLYISRAMDLHDLARERGPLKGVMAGMGMPSLCVGIDSDILYPAHEQRAIASQLGNARYREIASPHGHDAFLIEYDQLTTFVVEFLNEVTSL